MSDNQKRLEFVDIAKSIAIVLVVLGHVVSSNTTTKLFLYSFHMPLFFILSGFFFQYSGRGVEQTRKKFFALIVPFFLWGAIYCNFSLKNLAFVFYGTRETLCVAHSLSSLWFLPALFVGFVFNYLFSYVQNKLQLENLATNIIGVIFFFVLGFAIPHMPKYGFFWSLDVGFVSAAFIRCGLIMKNYFCTLRGKPLYAVLIPTIFLTVLFVFTFKYSISSVGYILMANALYGHPLIFVGNSFLGSSVVILVSLMLERIPCRKNFISLIGKRTLGIFLVHKPFAELGRKIVEHFHMDYNSLPIAIPLTCGVVVISVVLVLIIEKIVPSILGHVNKVAVCKK